MGDLKLAPLPPGPFMNRVWGEVLARGREALCNPLPRGFFLSSSGDVAGLTLVLTGGVKSRQPMCSAPRRDDDGLGSARVMLGPRVA